MFEYIIVGSGLSGAVIAERIANNLNKKVLVIERRNHIGGNCYDFKDENGIICHKYGPHLFHTEYKEVFEYLSHFTDWHIYSHRVLAFIDGKKVPIPFNFNSIDIVFPDEISRTLKSKLLTNFEYGQKIPILELLIEKDNDLKLLANYIYNKIFLNYTVKQWGLKPDEIDSAVTARVPIFVGKDDRYFYDRYQAVPKKGYSTMFENLLNHKKIKILLNTDYKELVSLDVKTKKIYFFDREFKGTLIFTGKIDELFNFNFGELPYRSIEMEFENINCKFYQESASVNYPNDFDFTRITEFKHIHPSKSESTTILKEYPKPHIHGKNDAFYPYFTNQSRETYQKYQLLSKNFKNIVLAGRLAEYKYYDMDDAVENALKIFEEKLLNGNKK